MVALNREPVQRKISTPEFGPRLVSVSSSGSETPVPHSTLLPLSAKDVPQSPPPLPPPTARSHALSEQPSSTLDSALKSAPVGHANVRLVTNTLMDPQGCRALYKQSRSLKTSPLQPEPVQPSAAPVDLSPPPPVMTVMPRISPGTIETTEETLYLKPELEGLVKQSAGDGKVNLEVNKELAEALRTRMQQQWSKVEVLDSPTHKQESPPAASEVPGSFKAFKRRADAAKAAAAATTAASQPVIDPMSTEQPVQVPDSPTPVKGEETTEATEWIADLPARALYSNCTSLTGLEAVVVDLLDALNITPAVLFPSMLSLAEKHWPSKAAWTELLLRYASRWPCVSTAELQRWLHRYGWWHLTVMEEGLAIEASPGYISRLDVGGTPTLKLEASSLQRPTGQMFKEVTMMVAHLKNTTFRPGSIEQFDLLIDMNYVDKELDSSCELIVSIAKIVAFIDFFFPNNMSSVCLINSSQAHLTALKYVISSNFADVVQGRTCSYDKDRPLAGLTDPSASLTSKISLRVDPEKRESPTATLTSPPGQTVTFRSPLVPQPRPQQHFRISPLQQQNIHQARTTTTIQQPQPFVPVTRSWHQQQQDATNATFGQLHAVPQRPAARAMSSMVIRGPVGSQTYRVGGLFPPRPLPVRHMSDSVSRYPYVHPTASSPLGNYAPSYTVPRSLSQDAQKLPLESSVDFFDKHASDIAQPDTAEERLEQEQDDQKQPTLPPDVGSYPDGTANAPFQASDSALDKTIESSGGSSEGSFSKMTSHRQSPTSEGTIRSTDSMDSSSRYVNVEERAHMFRPVLGDCYKGSLSKKTFRRLLFECPSTYLKFERDALHALKKLISEATGGNTSSSLSARDLQSFASLLPKLKLLTDAQLLRFLQAYDWEPSATLSALVKHLGWIPQRLPVEIDSSLAALQATGFCYPFGRDRHFRPVLVIRMGNVSAAPDWDTAFRLVLHWLTVCLECLMIPEKVEQFTAIVDLSKVSLIGFTGLNSSSYIQELCNNFPNRLNKIFVTETPSFFWLFWRTMVQPYIPSATLQRISCLPSGDKSFFKYISLSQVEKSMGGKAQNITESALKAFQPVMPQLRLNRRARTVAEGSYI